MSSMLDRMRKIGNIKGSIASKSSIFEKKDFIETSLPMVNLAFSGRMDGGIAHGITVIAGPSKSFKSRLTLFCLKEFQRKYPDGGCLFYDCEDGIKAEDMIAEGVDPERVIHIPVENIEQMKFDMVQKLNDIQKDEKWFIMVDSIGNMASAKEVEDAINEKSVADMTRAKAIKSLCRIILPVLNGKKIPCIMINHTYQTLELYSKAVVSGGTGIMYSANQVFIMSKAQIKDKKTNEILGYEFTMNIEKSRYVKERAKLTFTARYDEGLSRWSGLFDLAMDYGAIIKPKMGWYNTVDMETGEVSEKPYREDAMKRNDEFFEKLLVDPKFNLFVENRFKLGSVAASSPDDDDDEDDE